MQKIIENKLEELGELCEALKVKRLYLVGSAVNNNFRNDSDLDFLLTFNDDISVEEYTNNYFTLHYKLRDLFKREIDIITERSLSNPYLIDSLNEVKQLIYEA